MASFENLKKGYNGQEIKKKTHNCLAYYKETIPS